LTCVKSKVRFKSKELARLCSFRNTCIVR